MSSRMEMVGHRQPKLSRSKSPVRVLVVSAGADGIDDALALAAPRWLVETATEPIEALARARASRPTGILFEPTPTDADAMSLIRELATLDSPLPVVVLSAESDADIIRDALAAGAAGYLIKPVPSRAVRLALTSAMRGVPAFCPEALAAVAEHFRRAAARASAASLTTRELQILTRLSRDLQEKEMADSLNIAPGTLHNHLDHIYKKLSVHTRQEAVQQVFRLG